MKRNWNLYYMMSCGMCLFWILMQIVFVQFVHYHSQNRILNPNDYRVEHISAEDYAKLSNPNNRTVLLSNNTTIIKSDTWERIVLPNYQQMDGSQDYYLVTVKGTAPFAGQITTILIPIASLALVGFLFGAASLRQTISEVQ